ncbi:MAG: MFS transporter, partial [Actinomycetota bacterium]
MGEANEVRDQGKSKAASQPPGEAPGKVASHFGPSTERDPKYLKLLFVLLGTATFFEGYDAAINAVVLTDLAEAFQVDLERTGRLTGPIIAVGLGAFGALPISAIGDRIGRRPLLIATTFIYALFTGLTASAQTLGQFIVFQFLARTFLIAEYATAITIMTEEFPAAHRGRAMGTLTALGAFGVPTVAIFNYVLNDTALG